MTNRKHSQGSGEKAEKELVIGFGIYYFHLISLLLVLQS